MSLESIRLKRWRENTKNKLVDCCGGKCNKCGYNRCNAALDFHHLNESVKEFTIGSVLATPKKWEKIVEEVKKCILLCCICHRELHAGMWNLDEIEIYKPDNFCKYDKIRLINNCPVCGKETYKKLTCSLKCSGIRRLKCVWPSRDELIKLKSVYSRCQIADMLGVSDTAVIKYEKKLNIPHKDLRKK